MQAEKMLPWQKTQWETLIQSRHIEKLPHAMLLTGLPGLGKKIFAEQFARYLLCHAKEKDLACGQCKACSLQQAGSHPDFLSVTPEEGSQLIKIDQIRDVVHFVNETAFLGGARVIIIEPASAMHLSAANALLKTLEEPTDNTYLILVNDTASGLPATLSSRCQKILFKKPERALALTWLQSLFHEEPQETLSIALDMAGGAPLQARDFLQQDGVALRRDLYDALLKLADRQVDPLSVAARWEEKNVRILLQLLFIWVQDLLRFRLTGSQAHLINPDYQAAIRHLIEKMTQDRLLEYAESVHTLSAQITHLLNVNRPLLLRELFIRWVKLC